jgi:hypothetical protein
LAIFAGPERRQRREQPIPDQQRMAHGGRKPTLACYLSDVACAPLPAVRVPMTDRPKSTPERPLGSIARSEHPTGSADVGQSFEWRELSRSLIGSFQISGFDHDGLKVARGFGRQHGHRHLLESIGLRRDHRGVEWRGCSRRWGEACG